MTTTVETLPEHSSNHQDVQDSEDQQDLQNQNQDESISTVQQVEEEQGVGEEEEEGYVDGFSIPKMLACAGIGLVVGAGYSVVDQTLLHKKRTIKLPYLSDVLDRQMPDVVTRMEKFYSYKRLVRTQRGKEEFERVATEMLKQCEYFAALYSQIMREGDNTTPEALQKYIWAKQQTQVHFKVIEKYMRVMCVLIGQQHNLQIEHDFNLLYEAFQNRFWLMHQTIL